MIKIDLTIPNLAEKLREHERDILLVLAAAMQTNRAMMFDQEGAHNGKRRWADLKWRTGAILQKRGTLRKSFGPQNDGIRPGQGPESVLRTSGDTVTIGTKLLYARLMNDGTTKMPGGVLRPVRAKALKIPAPGGKKGFLFRKSVRIPARPMDEISELDKREWADTLEAYIAEVLNG